MRMQTVLRNAITVGMAIGLVGLIHPLRNRFAIDDIVHRALPGLPEEFRDDLESSMVAAPLTGELDGFERRVLEFIQYPYLQIERLHSRAFDNEVQRRVFLAQERQSLAPSLPVGVAALADIDSLRTDSLWQLGKAMYAACNSPAGQRFQATLNKPPKLTEDKDPAVKLVRTVFWAAYGDYALQQAVAGS